MNKILQVIKSSYFKSLKGEENFWVVLLGWGVGVYGLSIFFSFCLVAALGKSGLSISDHINRDLLFNWVIGAPFSFVGPFGLVFAFIYPLLFAYALIKSSTKRSILYVSFSIVILVIFFYAHLFYKVSRIIAFGSLFLIVISPLAWIVGLICIILIVKKTIKSLQIPLNKKLI